MQIERKGTGPWPEVDVKDAVVSITVGEDTRAFDCAQLQTDAQVTIDVVRGFDGHLAEGAANGSEYVANLIIPPKRYTEIDLPMPLAEEELPEDIDPACITQAPTTETVALPLTADEMESVRLILWTVNETNTHQEAF